MYSRAQFTTISQGSNTRRQSVKTTVYLTAHWNKYSKTFEYSNQSYPPSSDSSYILLETRELDVAELSYSDLQKLATLAIRNKKNKILADAHVEAEAIEQEIQELLAIEDKTGDVATPEQSSDNLPF
jgi:hypothetical protein